MRQVFASLFMVFVLLGCEPKVQTAVTVENAFLDSNFTISYVVDGEQSVVFENERINYSKSKDFDVWIYTDEDIVFVDFLVETETLGEIRQFTFSRALEDYDQLSIVYDWDSVAGDFVLFVSDPI